MVTSLPSTRLPDEVDCVVLTFGVPFRFIGIIGG